LTRDVAFSIEEQVIEKGMSLVNRSVVHAEVLGENTIDTDGLAENSIEGSARPVMPRLLDREN